MERTAKEYRTLMISVMEMAIDEAMASERKAWNNGDYERLNYCEGYLAGLREAQRKLEVSEFLTE